MNSLLRYKHQPPEIQDRIFFAALLLVAIPALWLRQAGSSYWRDEIGTVWNIKTDLATALAHRWTGQSALYTVIAWAAVAWGGSREIVARIPALLSMGGAAYLLYRIAIRMFDRGTALLAVLLFACLQDVAFAADDARPYALSLLAVNASMLFLLRWLDSGRWLDGVAWAAGAAAVLYGHYLFAPVLIVEAAYALSRIRSGSPARFWSLLAMAVLAVVFALPLLPGFAVLLRGRDAIHYGGSYSVYDLLHTLTPPVVIGPILLGLALAFALRPFQAGEWVLPKDRFLLVCAWAFFAPLLYFLLSFTGLEVFLPRYLLSSAPGVALLTAAAISALASGRSRRLVAVTVCASAFFAFGLGRLHGNEDWRGALGAVRSATAGTNVPVLLTSPFIEATDLERAADPNQRQLYAPIEVYPIGEGFIRLPMMTAAVNATFLDNLVTTELNGKDSFLLVTARESLNYQTWFMGRFADRLQAVDDLGDFGSISVTRFRLRP